jgi:hypothetical protein
MTLIFIIFIALIVFIMYHTFLTSYGSLSDIMAQYDLTKCTIYYNNTHAYIITPNGQQFIFAHDNKTLPIIKKYHPI